MELKLDHVHLKTHDPQKTAEFYVDCLGAKVVSQLANGGVRLDLHGLPLNVSRFLDGQKHKQVYGIEHIAIDTDDMPAAVAQLKKSGARITEEIDNPNGRRLCFFEGPDGVCLEVIGPAK